MSLRFAAARANHLFSSVAFSRCRMFPGGQLLTGFAAQRRRTDTEVPGESATAVTGRGGGTVGWQEGAPLP